MKQTAQDVMTRTVITASPGMSVEEAASLLARHRITGLPVLDEQGSVIGMISDFDLIGKHGQGRVVADIMTRQVISVSPDTDLSEIGHILTAKHIRRLPVVQGNLLVGLVSRGDLIRRIAQRWICNACGAEEFGPDQPERCASCGADRDSLYQVDAPPMMYRDM
jgi:CBS domain-containing protein